MRSMLRAAFAAIAALTLVLALAACGGGGEESSEGGGGTAETPEVEPIESNPENGDTSITIGSKNFTEQFILGEIYSQALEAGGYDVQKELNLGSEVIAFRALTSGQVDAYPEYTGTALVNFFDVSVQESTELDPDEAYELAREEYAQEGIVALPRGEFDNTYVVASLAAAQDEQFEGAETISDLAALPNADELTIAGFPECRQRADCLLGLEGAYDWQPEFISNANKFDPLDNETSDLGFVFGTDGGLTLDDYVTYEDDENLFPPYHITLGVREEALEAIGPEGEDILIRVQEPLTEDVMRELNSRVDLDREEPEDVAADYLREAGFVQ
jgi:glycine betaine/choline ABC-type transport system substrate-binding protein